MPWFVIPAPICNKTRLPQFVTQACPNLLYIYIFAIESCCSYYILCDLGGGYLIHRVTLHIDNVIPWHGEKVLSSSSLGQWPPVLARWDLSWVDHNYRVMWLIYHVITLYSQKGTCPVLQKVHLQFYNINDH